MRYANIIAMCLSVIFSLNAFRLRWPIQYKIFSVYLLIAFVTELSALTWIYFYYDPKGGIYVQKNHWIYTLSIIPQYLSFFAIYYFAIQAKILKKISLILIIVFFLFALSNTIFYQGFNNANTHTHIVANFVAIVLIFTYLEDLRKKYTPIKLSQHPMIWISLGSGVYHLLNIPTLYNLNHLMGDTNFVKAFNYFYQSYIFIMYILFIKAFLCPTPQK